ncbi:hypothetical protein HDU91_004138 [Kappamyces sp. JEL0680]|nr:hypothetical protein HDU91_004138 [Kappamyces sp. JEL0680]
METAMLCPEKPPKHSIDTANKTSQPGRGVPEQHRVNGKPIVCFYWSTGSCKRNPCPYTHSFASPELYRSACPALQECKYWIQASCRRGDKCPFYHPAKRPHDSRRSAPSTNATETAAPAANPVSEPPVRSANPSRPKPRIGSDSAIVLHLPSSPFWKDKRGEKTQSGFVIPIPTVEPVASCRPRSEAAVSTSVQKSRSLENIVDNFSRPDYKECNEIAPHLRFELKKHQKQGVQFCIDQEAGPCKGGILADDMVRVRL